MNERSKIGGFFIGLIKTIIPIIILAAGIAVAVYLIKTRPVAKKQPAQPVPTRVNVIKADTSDNPLMIKAMGTVKPAVQVDIAAQVSGQIVNVADAFVPGGRFEKQQTILQIDKRDYELAVKQRAQELEQARAKFRIEQGRQAVARQEFELLGESIAKEDEEFVLRKPQLRQAQAEVEKLEALLEAAKIDLERTTIKAPFNATVDERYVNLGSSVNTGGKLVTLYGTDVYWVELLLPVDELQWIIFPHEDNEGSKVKVLLPGSVRNAYREGEIVKLSAEIEPEGRMAKVLVKVENPLKQTNGDHIEPPLLAGSFVQVEITGIELANSVKIPRRALRDDNTIWLSNDGKLKKRQIEPVYKDDSFVYTSSEIKNDEKIITSDIASPIEGMSLKIEEVLNNE
jgi:RND family efflux transporter MFP subunit